MQPQDDTETSAKDLSHRPYEDVLAIFTGTLFMSLGVVMFGYSGLLTGGTAGVAFLLHYATGWNFGAVFFVINLPFYVLAFKRLGLEFTLKTFAAVGSLSVLVNVVPGLLGFSSLSVPFAAVMGGLLMGVGLLMMFRHRASLGGFNILALFCQERWGWRAGKIQMALDCSIVLCSFMLVDWQHVALSVLGAVMLNLTLALNHQPGRYLTM
jgi:uncharacterized membrane-anchored protein YitT (DUF2179 family)